MITLSELRRQLDDWLQPALIRDYCPNGLQVEGTPEIKKIVCGVTACEALIDKAIARKADALLVHHGYFWKGEASVITGMKKRRLAKLLHNNINLLAYHLPLDVHPDFGNNAGLARALGIVVEGRQAAGGTEGLLWYGRLPAPMSLPDLGSHVETSLERKPVIVPSVSDDSADVVETIAWCTGGAQGFIDAAAELGVDVYLSGEISEQTVHSAREQGIAYVAAGHHATERYGIQLLGEALAEAFDVEVCIEDVANPA